MKDSEKLNGTYKIKFLALEKLLREKSSKEKMLSTQEIINELAKDHISIDRRTLSKEMNMLRQFGVPIETGKSGHQLAYYIEDYQLTENELSILIYALKGASFVSSKDTDKLIEKLLKYGQGQYENLPDVKYTCFNINKPFDSSLFEKITLLQNCIKKAKKVNFMYSDYNIKGERVYRNNNKVYSEEPISLVFSDGIFYLLTQKQKYKSVTTYRVDRMDNVKATFESIDLSKAKEILNVCISEYEDKNDQELDEMIKQYAKQSFRMYQGKIKNNVTLLCHKNMLGEIFDRFSQDEGKRKKILATPCTEKKDWYRVSVRVQTSPTFFGWVAQYGGQIIVETPKRCRDEYVKFCSNLIKSLEE